MADAPDDRRPEWLAALRDPIFGDLMLTPRIVAPGHIPDVLKAFGKQPVAAQRRIVTAIDEMAIKFSLAGKRAPKKFATASAELKALEAAVRKAASLWKKATPYHGALLKAMILNVPPKERQSHSFEFRNINPGPALDSLLPVIAALRSEDIYARAFSQPPTKKAQARALLWEPLFDLMHDFEIADFGEHQPVIQTIRALHLVCRARPPDPGAVRQAHSDWRKSRALSSRAKSRRS